MLDFGDYAGAAWLLIYTPLLVGPCLLLMPWSGALHGVLAARGEKFARRAGAFLAASSLGFVLSSVIAASGFYVGLMLTLPITRISQYLGTRHGDLMELIPLVCALFGPVVGGVVAGFVSRALAGPDHRPVNCEPAFDALTPYTVKEHPATRRLHRAA